MSCVCDRLCGRTSGRCTEFSLSFIDVLNNLMESEEVVLTDLLITLVNTLRLKILGKWQTKAFSFKRKILHLSLEKIPLSDMVWFSVLVLAKVKSNGLKWKNLIYIILSKRLVCSLIISLSSSFWLKAYLFRWVCVNIIPLWNHHNLCLKLDSQTKPEWSQESNSKIFKISVKRNCFEYHMIASMLNIF